MENNPIKTSLRALAVKLLSSESTVMPDEVETRADYIQYILAIHGIESKEIIMLNRAEIQSGVSRVKFAEGLIKQLDSHHDGRNTWLLNYGIGEEAVMKRKKRGLEFVQDIQSCELG